MVAARVILVSLCDKGALGARQVAGMLKHAGGRVALVDLKEYNQRLEKHVRIQVIKVRFPGVLR